MASTTVSSSELAKQPTRAVKATSSGPVFITERGKLSHVLLSIEEYQRMIDATLELKTGDQPIRDS